ncbi:MAG: arginine--tRNA ligase [Saprospiraceae bacterium]
MKFIKEIKESVQFALAERYKVNVDPNDILVNETRKEFEGNYTVVIFPFIKKTKSSLQNIGESLGDYLQLNIPYITGHNVVKGFLNLEFDRAFWVDHLKRINKDDSYGSLPKRNEKVMVEFSSPNTNKPLHLGHIRNILLGWSTYKILAAAGFDVIKTQIINDRGIAVCKSMLAWQLFANNATPASTGIKSDHFVGDYYVLFDKKLNEEYSKWQLTEEGNKIFKGKVVGGGRDCKMGEVDEVKGVFFKKYKNKYFNTYSTLGQQAKAMLLKWEDNDPEIRHLWKQMNNWCYKGFDETYKKLGVHFDLLYYESDTYLLGKKSVEIGLDKGLFYKKGDGSVWVDLEDEGMDQKILLRSDGTSVYMTQDLGTAQKRYENHKSDKMIYVVGDEQEYHFSVLFAILKKLGASFADGLFHLSYGMVDLPTGKMKSREGTVVDADDLVKDVIDEAMKSAEERGDIASFSKNEKDDLFRKIGLGALKYFILKVDPKKRMVFNPKESVDMQGQTGPYIQNAYVRIQSILRKLETHKLTVDISEYSPENIEVDIIQKLVAYPSEIAAAAINYDPSRIASYTYDLAKLYHKFYHDLRILTAETELAKLFRIDLSNCTAKVLAHSMDLLGIEMPQRM